MLIAIADTALLLVYLIALPFSRMKAGLGAGVIVSVAFLLAAFYIPAFVVSRFKRRLAGASAFSPIAAGVGTTLGIALGTILGIWLGFRLLAASDSALLGEMSMVVISVAAALLGGFLGALIGLRYPGAATAVSA